jgi:hypothetical protein
MCPADDAQLNRRAGAWLVAIAGKIGTVEVVSHAHMMLVAPLDHHPALW